MIALILMVLILWVGLSIKVIKADEMGVLVMWGEPRRFVDSGIIFVPKWFPGCYLERFPKKVFNLDYPEREVITKEGDYGGVKYGSQVLKVNAVAYLRFPRNERLIEILRSGVPKEEKKLKDWTEEAVVGALRVVLGEITWKEATEKIESIRQRVQELFRRADGALVRAGFDPNDLVLTIKEIRLPRELEKALPRVDEERLKLEGSMFLAKREGVEQVGSVLEAFALAKGMKVEEVQKKISSDPNLEREFLDYAKDLNLRIEEAERGSFFHIKVDGAEGIEKTILEAIGLIKRSDKKRKESEGPKTWQERRREIKDWLDSL